MHLEGAVPLAWGMFISHKIADTVDFDGHGAVQVGHDIGLFIPQYNIIPPAPPNIWLAVTIPTSQAKVTFFKGSVVVEGKCAGNYDWLAPMWLNVCAEPVNLPLGQLIDAPFRNTVIFTFTWTDFLRGLLYTAVDSALSFLISLLLKGSPLGKFLKSLGEKYGQQVGYLIFQRLFGGIFRNINEALIEKWLGEGPMAKYISKGVKKLVQPGLGGLGLTDPTPEPGDESSAVVPSPPVGAAPPAPPAGNIINSAPLVGEP